jgi:hypothetical protein
MEEIPAFPSMTYLQMREHVVLRKRNKRHGTLVAPQEGKNCQ